MRKNIILERTLRKQKTNTGENDELRVHYLSEPGRQKESAFRKFDASANKSKRNCNSYYENNESEKEIKLKSFKDFDDKAVSFFENDSQKRRQSSERICFSRRSFCYDSKELEMLEKQRPLRKRRGSFVNFEKGLFEIMNWKQKKVDIKMINEDNIPKPPLVFRRRNYSIDKNECQQQENKSVYIPTEEDCMEPIPIKINGMLVNIFENANETQVKSHKVCEKCNRIFETRICELNQKVGALQKQLEELQKSTKQQFNKFLKGMTEITLQHQPKIKKTESFITNTADTSEIHQKKFSSKISSNETLFESIRLFQVESDFPSLRKTGSIKRQSLNSARTCSTTIKNHKELNPKTERNRTREKFKVFERTILEMKGLMKGDDLQDDLFNIKI